MATSSVWLAWVSSSTASVKQKANQPLGERGALYAASAKGDSPAVLNYRQYETWTLSADWQYTLPSGESITAIGLGGVPATSAIDEDLAPALGSGCIVVATDAGYLRFFSGSGLQTHFIDFPEEVVSISIGREWIFLAHRRDGVCFLFCSYLWPIQETIQIPLLCPTPCSTQIPTKLSSMALCRCQIVRRSLG